MNIYSGSRDAGGLAAALTNPTDMSLRKGTLDRSYPVCISGVTFSDAETAYSVCAAGADDADKDAIMIDIIARKLVQHPALYTAIAVRGGVKFLETCSHLTGAQSARMKRWEGTGRDSRFIRNLIAAYEAAGRMQ